jgi:hypothetical protein
MKDYRTMALGGGLAGLVLAAVVKPDAKTIILSTLAGMIAVPAIAGASPTELKKALLEPAKR